MWRFVVHFSIMVLISLEPINSSPITISSPAEGSRVASPFVVNLSINLSGAMKEPGGLAGWKVCLSGAGIVGDGDDDDAWTSFQQACTKIPMSQRCVAIRTDGEPTSLPEISLRPSVSGLAGAKTCVPAVMTPEGRRSASVVTPELEEKRQQQRSAGRQPIYAWLVDGYGFVVGVPDEKYIHVFASKPKGMVRGGFEVAASSSELQVSASLMASMSMGRQHANFTMATTTNDGIRDHGSFGAAVDRAEDEAARVFSARACASGGGGGRPLRVLVFSNSTSFRTGRAMAHYAEALFEAGCRADVGFIRPPLITSDSNNQRSEEGDKGGSSGDASSYYTESRGEKEAKPDDSLIDQRGATASGKKSVGFRIFDNWDDLKKGVGGQYDAMLLEKTGSDAERVPTANQLGRLSIPTIVLAIFAVWMPHGTVFAPLSSCTEGWHPGFPVLPFVSPPPKSTPSPHDDDGNGGTISHREDRALAIRRQHLGLTGGDDDDNCDDNEGENDGQALKRRRVDVEEGEVSGQGVGDSEGGGSSSSITGRVGRRKRRGDDVLVVGLIKGAVDDEDIVQWTKQAVVKLLRSSLSDDYDIGDTDDGDDYNHRHDDGLSSLRMPEIHLFLLGQGYNWINDEEFNTSDICGDEHANDNGGGGGGGGDQDAFNITRQLKQQSVRRRCGHGTRVHRFGAVSDESLKFDLIEACDVLFHVRSAGETFGNACAEFSHLGKPVLTTFSGACAHRIILNPESESAHSDSVITDDDDDSTNDNPRETTNHSYTSSSQPTSFPLTYAVVSDYDELVKALATVHRDIMREIQEIRNQEVGKSTAALCRDERNKDDPDSELDGGVRCQLSRQLQDRPRIQRRHRRYRFPPPSPYSAFSPVRVGRRLIELIDLAVAIKRNHKLSILRDGDYDDQQQGRGSGHTDEGHGHRLHALTGINLAITSPIQGHLLPAGNGYKGDSGGEDGDEGSGWDGLLYVDVSVSVTDAKKFSSLAAPCFPPSSWRLCLTASHASSFNYHDQPPRTAFPTTNVNAPVPGHNDNGGEGEGEQRADTGDSDDGNNDGTPLFVESCVNFEGLSDGNTSLPPLNVGNLLQNIGKRALKEHAIIDSRNSSDHGDGDGVCGDDNDDRNTTGNCGNNSSGKDGDDGTVLGSPSKSQAPSASTTARSIKSAVSLLGRLTPLAITGRILSSASGEGDVCEGGFGEDHSNICPGHSRCQFLGVEGGKMTPTKIASAVVFVLAHVPLD